MEPFFIKTRSQTSWKRRVVHTGGREGVKAAEVAQPGFRKTFISKPSFCEHTRGSRVAGHTDSTSGYIELHSRTTTC